MDMERAAKFQALQESETFEQELAMANGLDDLQALFAKHGIEMTKEEVEDMMVSASKLNGEELSAEELDDVSGGVAAWVWVAGKWVLKTVASWMISKGLAKLTGW